MKGNIEFTTAYPYNSDGFHKWCNYLGNKFYKEEEKWYDKWNPNASESVHKMSASVPCHSEFYKYLQWHKNAIFVTDHAMKIPAMKVHYEDFHKDLDGTMKRLADFLGIALVGEGLDFHFHTYDYFTPQERNAVTRYIKLLASPKLMQELERYI